MHPRTYNATKWVVVLASLGWMTWAGIDQFSEVPEQDLLTHSSPEVKERLRDCEGTFKQRYECKENIVIKTHRDTFYRLTERLAIVTVPAILAGLAFLFLVPKPELVVREQPDEDPDAWKRAAQMRTRIKPPHSEA
ncbi:MAG: hypothetical protein ACM31L_04365 [Actinomycetota bacterium]